MEKPQDNDTHRESLADDNSGMTLTASKNLMVNASKISNIE